MKKQISPSVMCVDFFNLAEAIAELQVLRVYLRRDSQLLRIRFNQINSFGAKWFSFRTFYYSFCGVINAVANKKDIQEGVKVSVGSKQQKGRALAIVDIKANSKNVICSIEVESTSN